MAKKKQKTSLIQRVVFDLWRGASTDTRGLPDDAVAELSEKMFSRTSYLARIPSLRSHDLELKLGVLCHRLREHLDPDDADSVRTALLAESIRDDFERLIHGAKPKALR